MMKQLRKRLKNQKGLTLIELLAVIVILGIIAAIAIPSIGGIIQKSKEDAVKADALTIINAGKLYVAANGVDATGAAAMDQGKLGEYVESSNSFTNYTVNYDGTKYTLTATDVPAGKINISFSGATIKGINDSPKGTTLITGDVSSTPEPEDS